MKTFLKKVSEACKLVFGYGIMIVLFTGGVTFFGYVAALIIGGEGAALICDFIYNKIVPVMIYATTLIVLFGLLAMYLGGEFALTSGKKQKTDTKEGR